MPPKRTPRKHPPVRLHEFAPSPWNPRAISPEALAALAESLRRFGGSGFALIAAEQLACRALLVEIDPLYCDVIVERWEAFTGRKAKLARRQSKRKDKES